MKTPERISYLLSVYTNGAGTADEERELFEWIMDNKDDAPLKAHVWQLLQGDEHRERYGEDNTGKALEQVMWKSREREAAIIRKKRMMRLRTTLAAAAAVILLLITTAVWFYPGAKQPQYQTNNATPAGHVNKAVLTLGDGSTVVLDNAANGALAKQGNTSLVKLDSGRLSYQANRNAGEVVFNTLATPRGGQYQVTLPDGTGVWLNASSSIRYPTAFTGNERKVELTGEAYFEVAGNAKQPFTVSVAAGGNEPVLVQVLGTHFNIMSYTDEDAVTTTLLAGAVRLVKGNAATVLVPGQQGSLQRQAADFKVSPADVEQAVAWKSGYFRFTRSSIETVMRQIARWYDIDVAYEGNVQGKDFGGTIPRNKKLTDVLNILEMTGVVRFKVEGRKVTVTAL